MDSLSSISYKSCEVLSSVSGFGPECEWTLSSMYIEPWLEDERTSMWCKIKDCHQKSLQNTHHNQGCSTETICLLAGLLILLRRRRRSKMAEQSEVIDYYSGVGKPGTAQCNAVIIITSFPKLWYSPSWPWSSVPQAVTDESHEGLLDFSWLLISTWLFE